MASKIKAIATYRPRIELGNTAQKPEFLRAVSRATNLTEGMVDLVIKEVRDQIIEFCRAGRGVKIESLGTYAPNISTDGKIDLQIRPDMAFINGLNLPGAFTGTVINREHIGMSSDQLVQMWNDNHPEEPITFSEN